MSIPTATTVFALIATQLLACVDREDTMPSAVGSATNTPEGTSPSPPPGDPPSTPTRDLLPDLPPAPPIALPTGPAVLYANFAQHPFLALRALDEPTPRHVLDMDSLSGSQLAVGHDGDTLAFTGWESGGWVVETLRLHDGERHALAFADGGWGLAGQAHWAPSDDAIAFTSFNGKPFTWDIHRVAADGRDDEVVASTPVPSAELATCIQPQFSPDGQEIWYSGWTSDLTAGVLFAVALDTLQTREVYRSTGFSSICGVRRSHRGDRVAFAAWDDARSAWILRTVPGGEIATLSGGFGVGQVDWSPDDTQLAFTEYDYDIQDAVLMSVPSTGGSPVGLQELNAGVSAGHPRWSPDGTGIAFVRFDAKRGAELVRHDVATGTVTLLDELDEGVSLGIPEWVISPAAPGSR